MKFRFYLVEEHSGCAFGTNSESVAQQAAASDSGFNTVIDTEQSVDLVGAYPIEQQATYKE
jgi:hypothetical protein